MSKRERDEKIENLESKVKELEDVLKWTETKMKAAFLDLDTANKLLEKYRKSGFEDAQEIATMRKKMRGALLCLMEGFEDEDE